MPCPSQSFRFNHPDYIRWTLQTMKSLAVEPSPLPIVIPLGLKCLRSKLFGGFGPENTSSSYLRNEEGNDVLQMRLLIEIRRRPYGWANPSVNRIICAVRSNFSNSKIALFYFVVARRVMNTDAVNSGEFSSEGMFCYYTTSKLIFRFLEKVQNMFPNFFFISPITDNCACSHKKKWIAFVVIILQQ